LVADGYLPDPDLAHGAAVVLVHGGGWSGGHRDTLAWHAHQLALEGYVACTIDYRLSGTAPYPAALIDCQSALKWVRTNSDRFAIDPNRVGVVGSSAGGHLVACLGARDDGPVSARANCVVDIHGIHDFIPIGNTGTSPVKQATTFLGGSMHEKPEIWADASPVRHVDAHTAPMLLLHDPDDELVPYEQSILLANALMRAARPMQFLPTPGSGHGFIYNPEHAWTQRVWPTVVIWLNLYLVPT
jgi:acetyl esterase/lipase